MKITHKIPGNPVSRDGCAVPLCILSNGLGGFLLLSDPPLSKYNGLFLNYSFDICKIIESIGLVDGSFDCIENHLTHIQRKHKGNAEKISFPEKSNGITYTLSKKAGIAIDFDVRKVNDLRSFGRNYEVAAGKDRITIRFRKTTDSREDTSHGKGEFSFCIIVKPKGFDLKKDYRFIDEWRAVHYSYDGERKDSPAARYIYRPFIINAKELLIAAARTEKEAAAELDKLAARAGKKEEPLKPSSIDRKKDPEAAAAFICAQDSLNKLMLEHKGITRLFAGYPWFFQLWSRDENVSLGALIRTRQFDTVKKILFQYMKNIGNDGRLPNFIPDSSLGSADGVGWFWKRMGDFIDALKELELLGKYISPKEQKDIRIALADSIARIEKNYGSEGLIKNKENETWMDTQWQGMDGRAGACIEVQALHLNMLRLAQDLAADEKEKKKYSTKESAMKKKVLESFWDGKALADTAGDFTQRPNIFIAYYVYPGLLQRREWETAFGKALDALWLEWGGLSSIDKRNSLFTPDYTGTDNRSYHRGDSWFWINNLAALCLFRNNQISFHEHIQKIIKAGSDEILWSGAIGHHAEVSSASHLSSKGCFAQAWSDAMFIELMSEIQGESRK